MSEEGEEKVDWYVKWNGKRQGKGRNGEKEKERDLLTLSLEWC